MGTIATVIKEYFAESPYAFVLLFGSCADGSENPMSDVDIGLFFDGDINVREAGYDAAKLGEKLNRRVDVTILNQIDKKDPLFAFGILDRHRPIVINNENKYIHFKTAVQLSYLDHKSLIDSNRDTLQRRIDEGKVGERNYA